MRESGNALPAAEQDRNGRRSPGNHPDLPIPGRNHREVPFRRRRRRQSLHLRQRLRLVLHSRQCLSRHSLPYRLKRHRRLQWHYFCLWPNGHRKDLHHGSTSFYNRAWAILTSRVSSPVPSTISSMSSAGLLIGIFSSAPVSSNSTMKKSEIYCARTIRTNLNLEKTLMPGCISRILVTILSRIPRT